MHNKKQKRYKKVEKSWEKWCGVNTDEQQKEKSAPTIFNPIPF